MVLRPGVGGIPGLFDGAQKKVAVPLKFRGEESCSGSARLGIRRREDETSTGNQRSG